MNYDLENFLVNPTNVAAKDFSDKTPEEGDKVTLLDGAYKFLPGEVAAKIARLEYVTIDNYNKLLLSDDNGENHYYTYSIYIKETCYLIGLYGHSWKYYK